MSKYRNKKTQYNCITFDSKLECERYKTLKALEEVGAISDLRRQVKFELVPQCKVDGKVKYRAKYYIADFVYIQNGEQIVEDAKGYRTDIYRLKAHLMLYRYGIVIKETTKEKK